MESICEVTESTFPHEEGFDSLHKLKDRESAYLKGMDDEASNRCPTAMRYLNSLYTKKLAWAPEMLIRSLSIYHYDEAMSLDTTDIPVIV
jgi:hypothetical protein